MNLLIPVTWYVNAGLIFCSDECVTNCESCISEKSIRLNSRTNNELLIEILSTKSWYTTSTRYLWHYQRLSEQDSEMADSSEGDSPQWTEQDADEEVPPAKRRHSHRHSSAEKWRVEEVTRHFTIWRHTRPFPYSVLRKLHPPGIRINSAIHHLRSGTLQSARRGHILLTVRK